MRFCRPFEDLMETQDEMFSNYFPYVCIAALHGIVEPLQDPPVSEL